MIYKQFNIWKKVNNKTGICYRIFEDIKKKKYYVQSKDHFCLPLDNKQITQLNKQLIELFVEEDISVREKSYSSIKKAINGFEKDFV